jgi:tight adherence protein B
MLGSGMTLLAIVALAMLSAGGLTYAALQTRIRTLDRADRRVTQIQRRSTTISATKARTNDTAARRRKSVQESLKELEQKQKARAKRSASPPIALRLQQAGLSWSKRGFVIFSVAIGSFLLFVTWVLGAPIYVAVATGIAGFFGAPRWFVNRMRNRRFKKFMEEFPNAIDVIVRGVKAGLPLNDCIRMISIESAEPVRGEFRGIAEAQAAGLGLAEAVERLNERVPVPETNFFGVVIGIQQKAGGNLAEALGNLSRVLRERKKMRGKISAMSMEAKASAAIIGALPFIVMMLVYFSSPEYIMRLFTEPLGHVILGASAFWMAVGIFVMKRMISFDV